LCVVVGLHGEFVALPPRTEVPELTARRGCVLASSAGYQLSALLAV